MEQRTKSDRGLYESARIRALEMDDDWGQTLIRAMNPDKLSEADVMVLIHYLAGNHK